MQGLRSINRKYLYSGSQSQNEGQKRRLADLTLTVDAAQAIPQYDNFLTILQNVLK